jgi:hypothetical protein
MVHVNIADVAPAAGEAHARSVALSNVPFLLKSIQPHNVALASTPASETVALYVVPAAPNEIFPLRPVVPSSAVMAVPFATASALVVGLRTVS